MDHDVLMNLVSKLMNDNKVQHLVKGYMEHLEKVARLSEQGAGVERIGQYLKGWWKWVRSGVELLGGVGLDVGSYWVRVGCSILGNYDLPFHPKSESHSLFCQA